MNRGTENGGFEGKSKNGMNILVFYLFIYMYRDREKLRDKERKREREGVRASERERSTDEKETPPFASVYGNPNARALKCTMHCQQQ